MNNIQKRPTVPDWNSGGHDLPLAMVAVAVAVWALLQCFTK